MKKITITIGVPDDFSPHNGCEKDCPFGLWDYLETDYTCAHKCRCPLLERNGAKYESKGE